MRAVIRSAEDIFTVAYEPKDLSCLDAFRPCLEAVGSAVLSIDLFADLGRAVLDNLRAFLTSPFPVAVIASVSAGDVLRSLRPPETFLCIGVEHGFAPFKGYIYDRGLLQADYYFAPSTGWAERLSRLYPDQRAKIRVGGYPKLEVLRERISQVQADKRTGDETSTSGRMLVIFSWGISETALCQLPDEDWIDYLLHPGDADKVSTSCLAKARVHVSNAELAAGLIGSADLVVGDFSSLTLECICLGKPVVFLLDRNLYTAACDFDEAFLDRASPDFGRIPFSHERIARHGVLDATQFTQAVSEHADIQSLIASTERAEFPHAFVPPRRDAGRRGGAAEILRVIAEERGAHMELTGGSPNLERINKTLADLQLVTRVYYATLGRAPDIEGLRHYRDGLRGVDGAPSGQALTIAALLSGSEESIKRNGKETAEALAESFRLLAQVERLSGCATPTLNAISAYDQAENWREWRDAARNCAERAHWGLKLVGAQVATGHDLATLAVDSAGIGQHEAALAWFAKARNCGYEASPDTIIVEAKSLEQLGRYEEALESAKRALRDRPSEAIPLIEGLRAQIADELLHRSASADVMLASAASLQLLALTEADDANSRQIRLSLLAATGRATRDTLIDLSHACAELDLLRDALHWLGKAEDMEPLTGELMRFKASLLERSRRFKEALRVASMAKKHDANPPAILADIARLRRLRRARIGRTFWRLFSVSD